MPPPMTSLATHPEGNSIRLQLRQNLLLQGISAPQWAELEPLLAVADYRKGDPLVRQGDEEMEQFFILEGMLKRVVSNPEGREMILRFAAESEMDTSYAAWRLRTPVPYSIVAVTKVRTAELTMPLWVEYLERHPDIKSRFEYEEKKMLMSPCDISIAWRNEASALSPSTIASTSGASGYCSFLKTYPRMPNTTIIQTSKMALCTV